MSERTADGKSILWNKKTGQRIERYPIDASAMLASGEFSAEEPSNAVNEPENPNATPSPAPVRPAGPFDTGLPKVTPTGERAVHSTFREAQPAGVGPQVTRTKGKGK